MPGCWLPVLQSPTPIQPPVSTPQIASNRSGVYVLMESIRVDKHRVNITKMGAGDNLWPAVTGGYVVSMDKIRSGEEDELFFFDLPSSLRIIVDYVRAPVGVFVFQKWPWVCWWVQTGVGEHPLRPCLSVDSQRAQVGGGLRAAGIR